MNSEGGPGWVPPSVSPTYNLISLEETFRSSVDSKATVAHDRPHIYSHTHCSTHGTSSSAEQQDSSVAPTISPSASSGVYLSLSHYHYASCSLRIHTSSLFSLSPSLSLYLVPGVHRVGTPIARSRSLDRFRQPTIPPFMQCKVLYPLSLNCGIILE